MTDNLLADAIEEFLAGRCTPQRVREIEAQPDSAQARALWSEVNDSGFLDALTPEASGGAGLGLGEAALISMACGRHAMPFPLMLTTAVRPALALAGKVLRGPITVAPIPGSITGGAIRCSAVSWGRISDWVLLCTPSGDWMLPTTAASRQSSGGHGSLAADIRWPSLPEGAFELGGSHGQARHWRATAAALVAAQMAGAMDRILEMTLRYANERSQFGKPIGKLQAIQQQVSVMAEQTFAARSAALIGLSAVGDQVHPLRAAISKARAGEAAVTATAVSHAVHGAIGVTEEFDLQLYTRRLHEWRGQYGGETYWHEQLGLALIDDAAPPLEFIQKLASAT